MTKIDKSFLQSKVGLRIFTLFVVCALLPITVLAVLSFSQVTKQLNEQARGRLKQAAKSASLTIHERLIFLENEMKLVSTSFGLNPVRTIPISPAGLSESLTWRFVSMAIFTEDGRQISLFGNIKKIPSLSESEKAHIRSGLTLLTTEKHPDRKIGMFMIRLFDQNNHKRGILVGEINTAYLWKTDEQSTLPVTTELSVFDQANTLLFSSVRLPPTVIQQVAGAERQSPVGQFEWRHDGEEYLASYRSIFLQPVFFAPKWTIMLSESKSDLLSAMTYFKKVFPPVIVVSLLVVVLLSIIQIRRSLIPLEKLREGTKRIARRDFESRVTIKSGDEFEELATSFNLMAGQLDKQFKALSTLAEIDRAILSALEVEKIVDVVLNRLHDIFPCKSVSVALLDPDGKSAKVKTRIYGVKGRTDDQTLSEMIDLTPQEQKELTDHPDHLLIEVKEEPPQYLALMVRQGIRSFAVFPVILKQMLTGMIALGYLNSHPHSQEDLAQGRRFANQMAVALSNAYLIKDLDQLNWGTLTALARAIDAKSPWRAGHSERVTDLSIKIGKVLGLSQEELDTLRRGGLLHDLGKIGIPAEILDKPGKLNKEEKRTMQQHAQLGAHILEPISAYAEVIPMVVQHHEHYSGTGYPAGLIGGAISFGARIFAVADAYDAITSDRPYRKALGKKRAIEIIKDESGKQFDPKVVEAFLKVIEQENPEEFK